MESWDLFIPYKPDRKRNGQFAYGCEPFNKGRKWDEWMSAEEQDKMRRHLREVGKGNRSFGDFRKRAVACVGIDSHKVCFFDSMIDAAGKTGVNYRNIRKVCNKERHKAGGFMWFYAEDKELKQYV